MGHVSQDIHLADTLRKVLGISPVFAGDFDTSSIEFLKSNGVERIVPLNPDTENYSLKSLLESTKPQISVIDVLERDTDSEYMALFRQHSGIVVAITASSQPRLIEADLVFAFNVNQKQGSYTELDTPVYYTGPDYFILPPRILKAKLVRTKTIRKISRVLVVFGGVDPNDTALLVARSLTNMPLDVTFIVSPLYRHVDALAAYVHRSFINGRVKQNVDSMAPYLQMADLLICNCGNIAYEGCAVGVPMITVNQVVRQEEQAVTLDSMGCLVNAGMENSLSTERLSSVIKKIIENRKLQVSMRQRAMETVDGNGLSRITSLIESTLSRHSSDKLSTVPKK